MRKQERNKGKTKLKRATVAAAGDRRAAALSELAREHGAALGKAADNLAQTEGLLASSVLVAIEPACRHRVERLVRLWAYLYLVEKAAWEQFCAELQVQPADLTAGLPGYRQALATEKRCQHLAYSAAEANLAARQIWGPTVSERTFATVLDDFRGALAQREQPLGDGQESSEAPQNCLDVLRTGR